MAETCKILVVDDEPDLEALIRMKFRRQMRNGELDFVFARDGMEALEKLDADRDIDIVLTDINMPRMDGLTLLGRMAELERLLGAVVVSAYGDMANIRAAMNRGAFDFLMKPIELDDLEITINKSRENIERLKKAALVRSTFGRYVSDEVVSTLLDSPEALELGGQRRRVTMLMSDVRGFSAISKARPPEEVVEMLNVLLGKMTDVIIEHDGTINEFIGDAVFVLFGAPIQREDDAERAVACAVRMQLAMEEVNAGLEKRGLPALEIGIGIHCGDVVIGNIGSERRMKYGAVGSHVNLTSRIESYTVGGQILVSESTLDHAGPHVRVGEEMQMEAKGFSEPVNIYSVEGIGEMTLPVRREDLKELAEPLAFRAAVLDGKHMKGETFDGAFVRLSKAGGMIRTARDLHRFDNLKIALPTPGDPTGSLGDLYAKVIDEGAGDDLWNVRFTAVPEDVADAILRLTSA